jgi:hypothetical protein
MKRAVAIRSKLAPAQEMEVSAAFASWQEEV